jgi:hypothetical protein
MGKTYKPDDDEVMRQAWKASESLINNKWTTRWPGMTYEQGVFNALEWVAGRKMFKPMEDKSD